MAKIVTKVTGKKKRKVKPKQTDIRWHDRFVEVFRETKGISQACTAVNICRLTAYRHKKKYPKFREAWDNAHERNIDELEQATLDRALNGWTEDVFYQGVVVGQKQIFSNVLAIFMLKHNRNVKYQEDRNIEPIGVDELAVKMHALGQAMNVSGATFAGNIPDPGSNGNGSHS